MKYFISSLIVFVVLVSCGKKTVPPAPNTFPSTNNSSSNPSTAATGAGIKTGDSAVVVKKAVKPPSNKLTSVPKVIVVSDAGAKKAVDGRLYYDLQGHRYWRSNKDGKYYLYNKSMQNDEAFKAPK